MSSSVCQGLQSCLEPRVVEQRVLRLKLAPPLSFGLTQRLGSSNSDSLEPVEKPHSEVNSTTITTTTNNKKNDKIIDDCNIKNQKNGELGHWSFIKDLTNASHSFKEVLGNDKVYVHPLVKRSSSMLSPKSLEMCTESLGSESGSCISHSSHGVSSLPWHSGEFAKQEQSKPCKIGMKNKMTRSRSFPPPLTSISGKGGVQVRPHREDGRLVIEAVAITPSQTCFHAERSNGRLRLLLKDCYHNCNNEAAKGEDDEQVAEEEVEAEQVEEGDNEEGDKTETQSLHWGEETEESNGNNVAGDIELGKLSRPSRCMEGGGHTNNSIMNWESLWVATS